MSGYHWQYKAQQIIDQGLWPDNISQVDRKAVEAMAAAERPYEPYYTLKIVIHSILSGDYQHSRFSEKEVT